ncbi:hypothetical protein HDU67_005377 [Dinochytrium kinnereticum]|nr:hypothetical protein HDU67_005377 [Dinochytrium kinnereticum]
MDRLVVWALDEDVAFRLIAFREEVVGGDFVDSTGRVVGRPQRRWRTPLGIYFDRKITTTPKYTTGAADLRTYFGITELRNYFYVRILDDIGINFAFTDADVFFLSDPFEDLNLPYGVRDHTNRTKKRHGKNDGTKSFYRDFPDLIYSTDARKPYHLLPDPYEGQTRIPHICGGFFFARSNPRTVRLFRTIRDFRMNDQWGIDYLLNEIPSVLVDPLPAGLTKRKHAVNMGAMAVALNDAWRSAWRWKGWDEGTYFWGVGGGVAEERGAAGGVSSELLD